jgi:fibronectin type 3 domain-containing protein
MAYVDTSVANGTQYWYRVFALGDTVGDTQVYPTSTLGFPTMSADSVSNTASATVGIVSSVVAAPTNLTAALQSGPQVSLTWRDNATNETGFLVERCAGAGCTNFAQIAVAPPRSNTGNTTYVDATVTAGTSYLYRVAAVNSTGVSAYVTLGTAVVVPAIPAAPTGFTVSAAKANGNNYTATLNWSTATNPANFTIERATNLSFTTGFSTSTVAGSLRTVNQTVNRNTTYYYRIRANNNGGVSSAFVNAQPFPIRTGP